MEKEKVNNKIKKDKELTKTEDKKEEIAQQMFSFIDERLVEGRLEKTTAKEIDDYIDELRKKYPDLELSFGNASMLPTRKYIIVIHDKDEDGKKRVLGVGIMKEKQAHFWKDISEEINKMTMKDVKKEQKRWEKEFNKKHLLWDWIFPFLLYVAVGGFCFWIGHSWK